MATIRSNPLTDRTAADVHESWTPERRSGAIPKPLPTLDPDRTPPSTANDVPERGEEASSRPQPPSRPISTSRRMAAMAAADTIAQPVSDPTTWPYLSIGKLFFSQGGTDYVGSAAAIGNNILLTAGHCAYENGNWSQDIEFYPAYPDLYDPWPFREYFVPNWETTSFNGVDNYEYDFAMMWVPAGMQSDIGYLGWVALAPTSSTSFTSVGYPSASPFPGDQMYQAVGTCIDTGNPMEMNNNDMTPGCSGGPWMITYNGQQGYANGVNSFRYNSQPTTLWSPQFLQDFVNLWDWVNSNHP